MGYTTQASPLLLGLGVSSISDTGTAFAQNSKTLHEYYAEVNEGKLAVHKGYFLTPEDKVFRRYILDIACKGQTRFEEEYFPVLESVVFPKLRPLQKDGLIEWDEFGLQLTPQGRYFIRNVCSAFDLYLHRSSENKPLFSKAI
jgi:oxygen-independent coproporphyrinogen III oxidase